MSVDPMEIAAAKFDLAKWCERMGFASQGYRKEEWLSDCPFCGNEDKLSVNSKRRKWRCFICQRGFSLVDLVAAFEGSFSTAVQTILAGGGLREGGLHFIPELDATAASADRSESWEPDTIGPPRYFEPLTEHVAYTQSRGFELANLQAIGAGICSWGRYQGRLVFPVRRFPDAGWLYFQTRATWEKSDQSDGKYRKNLNPVTFDVDAYATASDVMLGVDLIEAYRMDWAELVEGPTDWLGVGIGAAATFGKTISPRQVSLLVRAGVRRVYLGWDPDAWVAKAGRKSPGQRAAEMLSAVFDLYVIRFAPDVDPGALTPTQNAEARSQAVPWEQANRLAHIP